MKKLIPILLVIVGAIVAFFEYKSYKRFNPPASYEFFVSADIDVNYHDPALVQKYYESALQISSFARSAWSNYDIDVLSVDDENPEGPRLLQVYNSMIANTQFLEQKLLQSANLKKSGYANNDVKQLEETGKTKRQRELEAAFATIGMLKKGDSGQAVWEIQKILNQKQITIPTDGTLGSETEDAIKEFQQANDRFPSGNVDFKTYELLMGSKKE